MNYLDITTLYEAIPPFPDNLHLKIRSYKGLTGVMPHWHEHIELDYILSGECCFIDNGIELSASRGDLLIFNSSSIHSISSQKGVDILCLLIEPAFFGGDNREGIYLKNVARSDSTIMTMLNELILEWHNRDGATYLMQASIVYRLVAHLFRKYRADSITKKDIELQTANLSRIKAVYEYINNSYKSSVTTADIAAEFYISESHFCRFFKRITGKTFIEYLNGYRINKAIQLLLGTTLTVTEVSSAVGFENINYFSRLFKRQTGKTPTELRTEAKEKG